LGFLVIGWFLVGFNQNLGAEEKSEEIELKIIFHSKEKLKSSELDKIKSDIKNVIGPGFQKLIYTEKPELVTGNIVFWTLVTFGVLIVVLGKFGWKPIVEALDNRINKIKGDIDHAEKAKAEAEKVLAEQKAILGESRAKSDEIISKAKVEGTEVKDEIVSKAHKEAHNIIDKAKTEAELAKSQAIDELKNEVSLISLDIAGKVIGKTLSLKDHEDFIMKSLRQYESKN